MPALLVKCTACGAFVPRGHLKLHQSSCLGQNGVCDAMFPLALGPRARPLSAGLDSIPSMVPALSSTVAEITSARKGRIEK
jgi:hypothetical protein